MEYRESPSSTAYVESLILELFDMSEREAHDHAISLMWVHETWGRDKGGTEWRAIVKQALGRKAKWRCETLRKHFLAEQANAKV